MFLGARLALQDVSDSTLLATATVDRDNHSTVFNIEGSRRLANNWTLGLEARFFTNIAQDDALSSFRRDDYIQLSVARYF